MNPSRPLDHAHPRLAPHFMFRWEASQQAYILLYPEGLIKLNASAGEILKRCDGQRSVDDIVAELQAAFPDSAEQIESGTRAFVDTACAKGWLQLMVAGAPAGRD
ncbi:pyrroloquinoline quinone biosynthesis peptide chaperone PqqD [Pseudogulbenkiania subflava]|uniref:Pyrroloquinoline quinone biosynthesis protein D n=1 Tax=Pseudogulbenkiania subflava DSM 22618 TaxID=1123014 RepID=A0A1Y6BWF3_9NEIS|nr:pyrroloquinoline quinone biosynthesis peptide chaperone PqqD [Pseudogulbenkiania subflava]SMF28740.1 pyrroloquinoline quinone biosynthesis protein D [Pseudogulbenkiania subflava DSM 22618]